MAWSIPCACPRIEDSARFAILTELVAGRYRDDCARYGGNWPALRPA